MIRGETLHARLVRAIALAGVIVLTLFTAVLMVLMHRYIHRQTDALLLHLAHAEAHSIREEGAGLHLHDLSVALPLLPDGLTRRHAVIFDHQGQVLARSPSVPDAFQVPEAWFEPTMGGYGYYNTERLGAKEPLRVAVVATSLENRELYIAMGVPHAAVDASVWAGTRVAVPLALLAVLVIALAGRQISRRATDDLARLSAACRNLRLDVGDQLQFDGRAVFAVAPGAVEEVHQLGDTLADLTRRMVAMMEAQQEFVAEAAHELRTPLTALHGELELALRREREGPAYRDAIQSALSDVERLNRLAETLLASARLSYQPAQTSEFPLHEAVGDSLQRFSREFAALPIQTAVHVADHLQVRADFDMLTRVLDNLFQNVLRHAQASKLLVEAKPQDGHIHLLVADDGNNLPNNMKNHLFVPFQHAGAHAGHGLGLYIAKQLMRHQGGDLRWLASGVEGYGGACWQLVIPVA